MLERISIKITGTVQGVGFRPTVYRYATALGLTGTVANTSSGVLIEIEGEQAKIEKFIIKLKNDPPAQAEVESFSQSRISPINDTQFCIITSTGCEEKNVEISPDLATCPDCLNEIKSDFDRRFSYPFTNCTNCGPRFSIILDRPYDRKFTSMKDFLMCENCANEYLNPTDRRFHAQPNACSICGPGLKIIGMEEEGDLIEHSIGQIKRGKIASIKGLGGFNLVCDPRNFSTVARLRMLKRRPNKAFALMVRDLETASKICEISDEEANLLESAAAPIVLLKKAKKSDFDHISPDNNYLGIMLPYTPLHHLLFCHTDVLLMTSANRTLEPIAINEDEVRILLDDGFCDFALTHDREIINRADDSIVQVTGKQHQMIRRSRGYVPKAIKVEGLGESENLSLGGNLKNSFALRKGKKIFLSQHIGELSDIRNYNYQLEQIDQYKELLEIRPSRIICDAHPGYENYSKDYHPVWHHHAHILSCMGEHNLLGKEVLGISCDGLGLGVDENLWGFEFLKVGSDYKKFERIAHLEYFPLPGGDKASYEIDRIAISLTAQTSDRLMIPIDKARCEQILKLIGSGINCPLTSSLGRLFDGVAALIGILDRSEYEARAAMQLQKYAEDYIPKAQNQSRYWVEVVGEDPMIVDYHKMINELLVDLNNRVSQQEIAYKFHIWAIDSIIEIIKKVSFKIVVFSGGCFSNRFLTENLMHQLQKNGINFYFNEEVPINDGGISFGQALI